MSLGILNNISALYAQNSLNSTQNSLQNTLQQLSSGSRINSGADDAAGLAVADGLHANEAALTQSSQNATAGIGLLQTADGALSQVTNLLDRAVTLATESANGTLTGGQVSSANQEYQNILSQIGNIGATTNFNSSQVFSSSATNIVVTDGTSSGLNTYADIVGSLNTASVGTTASAATVTATDAPANVPPVVAQSPVAGQYTLTAANSGDLLNGTLSFSVGSSTTPTSVTIAANSTLTQVAQALTTAGLNSSVSGNVINIVGPTSGSSGAANTVTFTSNLSDTPVSTALGVGAVGIPANPGLGARGTLAISGTVSDGGGGTLDQFGGTIVLNQAGQASKTITIQAGSNLGPVGSSGTVEYQIAQQLQGSGYSLAADTGPGTTATTLNFVGADSLSPVTIDASSTFADSTTVAATAVGGPGTAGAPQVAGTYVLAALGSATDTFGSGAANTLDINGTSMSIAGMTATAAMQAINNNTAYQGLGVSATVGSGTTLTIHGNSTGSALTVHGNGNGVLQLTDQAPNAAAISTIGITSQATGTAAAGATSTITLSSATATLSGNLSVKVNTGANAKTATLTVAANTTGQALANQINQSTSFQTAGVTANFNSTTGKVVLTGPTGSGNTIDTTGTLLTDTSSSAPGAGANFTTSGVSQLTAATASTILTTVTAAVADVAYQRGTIGADINQLTSASNVTSSEGVNLTSAEESIRATNYGQAASDLSKYQILSQTGISALAQANSVQQEVLKLLQ
jgi:flagellin